MWFEIQNLNTKVVKATDGERRWLFSLLTFDDPAARYKMQKGLPHGETEMHLYNDMTATFPTGNLGQVVKEAKLAEIPVELVDRRVKPCERDLGADLGWLRDYQLAAVEEVAARSRGILKMPTGCLAGDATIECNRAGWSFKISLAALVARFNGKRPKGTKGNGPAWDCSVPTYVRARDADGYVRLHLLAAALDSGVKTTYCVTTESGRTVRATEDHRFLTGDGWKRLKEISVGDFLFVDGGVTSGPPKKKSWYRLVNGLRGHPHAGRRGVKPGKGGFSVPQHRLVAESALNGMSYDNYVKVLRGEKTWRDINYLDPKKFAVHHLDGNPLNNSPENLAVVSHKEHARGHGEDGGWMHVAASTKVERVVGITLCGKEATYDLVMAGEPHNFLANGIVVHNSGKGELPAALGRMFPCRWLFLVHRSTLVGQTADRFEQRTGEKAGRILDGHWSAARVTFATFQTVYSKFQYEGVYQTKFGATKIPGSGTLATDLLHGAQGLVIDECHTTPADTFWKIAMATPNAYFRVGLSATPLDREDRRSILAISALGRVIYKLPASVLVERGILARPKIRMVPVYQKSDRPTWQGVYGECIVRSKVRNETVVECAAQAAKPCLVFVKEVSHGKALAKQLAQRGLSTAFVWGNNSTEQRDKQIKLLEARRLDVLVCSVVFQEGVDIPTLASVVVASGGKSIIATLQRIGRGMRSDNGRKPDFEVFDLKDEGCPMLERHSLKRLKAYAGEGFEVTEGALVTSPKKKASA